MLRIAKEYRKGRREREGVPDMSKRRYVLLAQGTIRGEGKGGLQQAVGGRASSDCSLGVCFGTWKMR